jgi:RNA polymerase sigma factor (sigma-70 family)
MMRRPTDQGSHGGLLESRLLEAREQFLGYIRKRVDDPELAEDILQDSLLRAIQATPALRDERRLVPWFYSILQHAIIDAYRRRGAAPKHIPLTEGAEPSLEPDDEAELCECFRSRTTSRSAAIGRARRCAAAWRRPAAAAPSTAASTAPAAPAELGRRMLSARV